ncbi:MAG: right-handed parallel beta-helix repeat-containing protein [Nitrososphaera sp.]
MPAISCGDILTSNTKLADDITCTDDQGLAIGANNITLDCNGHAVNNITPFNFGTGIKLSGISGAKIKNCSVTGEFYGFNLANSSNNVLTGNTVNDSTFGFYIGYNSNYNKLINNNSTISNSENFALYSNTHNTLAGNYAGDYYGYDLQFNCTHESLFNNTAVGHPFSNGIGYNIGIGSDNNLLKGNTATLYDFGYYLLQANNNTLQNNNAVRDIDFGYYLQTSSNNKFVSNVGSNTGPALYSGFGGTSYFAQPDSIANLFAANQANNNTNVGFYDQSLGKGKNGTANRYTIDMCSGNSNGGSNPGGLCENTGGLAINVKLSNVASGVSSLNMNVTLIDGSLVPLAWQVRNVPSPSNGENVFFSFNNVPPGVTQYFVCAMESPNTSNNSCTIYPLPANNLAKVDYNVP